MGCVLHNCFHSYPLAFLHMAICTHCPPQNRSNTVVCDRDDSGDGVDDDKYDDDTGDDDCTSHATELSLLWWEHLLRLYNQTISTEIITCRVTWTHQITHKSISPKKVRSEKVPVGSTPTTCKSRSCISLADTHRPLASQRPIAASTGLDDTC